MQINSLHSIFTAPKNFQQALSNNFINVVWLLNDLYRVGYYKAFVYPPCNKLNLIITML